MRHSKSQPSSHNNSHSNHYTIMFFIMILSGLLSTMNIWADKLSDLRLSLNDVYMIMLMTGWMFFFMGMFYRDVGIFVIGGLMVALNIYFIRNQTFITEEQYKLGMIPHHSMAVHMSKKLLEKETNSETRDFLKNLINTQEKEIIFLKKGNPNP